MSGEARRIETEGSSRPAVVATAVHLDECDAATGLPKLAGTVGFVPANPGGGQPKQAPTLEESVRLLAALRAAVSAATRQVMEMAFSVDETEVARLLAVYAATLRSRSREGGRVVLVGGRAAFIDVECPGCKGVFGWLGDHRTRPACPFCEHRPPQAELDALQDQLDGKAAAMAAAFDPERGRRLLARRKRAGLTVGKACAALGVTALMLARWERGGAYPASMEAKFDQVYGPEDGR